MMTRCSRETFDTQFPVGRAWRGGGAGGFLKIGCKTESVVTTNEREKIVNLLKQSVERNQA